MEDFSELIKSKRLANNLSLRELGKMTGLNYSYLARLEKGSASPSKITVLKIANTLNIPGNELLIKAGFNPDDVENSVTLGSRLYQLRNEKFLSQKELAEYFNLDIEQLNLYEQDKRKPDYKTLDKFANFFEVTINYLLGFSDYRKPYSVAGKKQQSHDNRKEITKKIHNATSIIKFYIESDETNDKKSKFYNFTTILNMAHRKFKGSEKIIPTIEINDILGHEDIEITHKGRPLNQNERDNLIKSISHFFAKTPVLKIPLYNKIFPHTDILDNANYIEDILISTRTNADFALKIMDDSMAWAGINTMDIAIIKKEDTIQDDDIIAIDINDGLPTFRFYKIEGEEGKFKTANPYQNDEILQQYKILGRVTSIIKYPPKFSNYINLLNSFDNNKQEEESDWEQTKDIALSNGMNAKEVQKLIELFSHMSKNM